MRVDFQSHFKMWRNLKNSKWKLLKLFLELLAHFVEQEDVVESDVHGMTVDRLEQAGFINLRSDPGHAKHGKSSLVALLVKMILKMLKISKQARK